MKAFRAALQVEYIKARRSKVLLISVIFFAFIGMIMGLLLYAAGNPDFAGRSSMLQMKTSFVTEASWSAFYELMLQIVLTLGMIGAGVITAWNFAREFAEGVLKDLLSLPVTRSVIVLSKLMIVLTWSMLLSVVILVAAIITGLAIGLDGWDPVSFSAFLGRYMFCALLNTLLVPVVAFVASAGRGYMLPFSLVILLLIFTQLLLIGLPRLSPWFPWALPALVSRVAGEAAPPAGWFSYLLFGLTVIAGTIGTVQWWKLADHK